MAAKTMMIPMTMIMTLTLTLTLTEEEEEKDGDGSDDKNTSYDNSTRNSDARMFEENSSTTFSS